MEEELIKLDVKVNSKEEAVRVAGNLLHENGYVTEKYVDSMIDVMKEFGPYIVITKGVALPHARPDEGAIKSGYCIVRLENPIEFGNIDNDPVSLLIGISATNSDEHLKNIQEVISILDNEERMNILMNGSKREILNILGGK